MTTNENMTEEQKQAWVREQYQNATKTKALLSSVGPVRIEQINKGDMPLFRVRVGPIAAVDQADKQFSFGGGHAVRDGDTVDVIFGEFIALIG